MKELAQAGNVSAACRKAKISRTIAYELRQAAADFAERWEEAVETATDALEQEAWRRAVKGVRKPTGWYQGKPGGHVQEYSDTLLVLLLKANRPKKYRENVDITSDGKPITIAVVKMPVDEL